MRRGTLFLMFVASLTWHTPAGWAASVTVTGTDGVAAPPAADAPLQGEDGQNGQAGGPATAVADAPDAENDATAVGGMGGAGAAGGNGLPLSDPNSRGGRGGSGGPGGNASATATGSVSSGPATAISQATGGAGGPGALQGLPLLPPDGPFQTRLDGGAGQGGFASATSNAASPDSATAVATGRGGASGGASASASAQARSGAATATAESFGALAGPQFSHASAESVSGDAHALAVATSDSGAGVPIASATSQSGNASAIARASSAADAFVTYNDLVSGSAGGRLTLIQEVTAGDAQDAPCVDCGGDAENFLNAVNPGGGELVGRVSAQGGFRQGPARAIVTSTVTNAARVESDASAIAGGGNYSREVIQGGTRGGYASATAVGLGEALSSSLARATNSHAHADATARSVGAVTAASATLDASGPDYDGDPGPVPNQDRGGSALAAIASSAALPQPVELRTGEGRVFASPSESDAAVWLSGSPNAQAAAGAGHVLALGSIAGRGGAAGAEPGTRVDQQFDGTLSLDLTHAELAPGSHLALAFLEVTPGAGAERDVLHLSLSRDDQTVFDRSYGDSARPLSELDDQVIDVGALLGTGDLTHVQLAFSLLLPAQLENDGALGLTLALIETPEPALLWLACALAPLLLLRPSP